MASISAPSSVTKNRANQSRFNTIFLSIAAFIGGKLLAGQLKTWLKTRAL